MRFFLFILIFVFSAIYYGCKQDAKQLDNEHNNIDSEKEIIGNQLNNEGLTEVNQSKIKNFNPNTYDTTINFQDGIKLVLTATDTVIIEEYFIAQKALDSLNNLNDNSYQLALDIEKYQHSKFGEKFKRDSSGLFVKLDNGKWNLLGLNKDLEESDNVFEYYFKEHGFYSIYVQWWEGNGYKLVNHINGEVIDMYGRPYFSPDGKFVISVSSDVLARFSYNGFQLFRNINGKLDYLGSFEPEDWGPYSVKWIENDRLVFKSQSVKFSENDYEYYDFYIDLKILM